MDTPANEDRPGACVGPLSSWEEEGDEGLRSFDGTIVDPEDQRR